MHLLEFLHQDRCCVSGDHDNVSDAIIWKRKNAQRAVTLRCFQRPAHVGGLTRGGEVLAS
jgi:hypothetical protein